MIKILTLRDGDIHPTIKKVQCIARDGMLITTSGLMYDAGDIFVTGNKIDNGAYIIKSIGTNAIEVFDGDGVSHIVSLEDIEWCDDCNDFHVCLRDNDNVDEYASGYADAIRDCVEYLLNSSTSTITKTLKKLNVDYLSDIDTDEKIAEFVSKRLEKKPQLTLDELKEIVGYDFDLV